MANMTKTELREGGLLSRWEAIANKYDTLNDQLSDPAVLAQPTLLVSLSKERAELEPIAKMFGEHRRVLEEIAEAQLMAEDQQLESLICGDWLARNWRVLNLVEKLGSSGR